MRAANDTKTGAEESMRRTHGPGTSRISSRFDSEPLPSCHPSRHGRKKRQDPSPHRTAPHCTALSTAGRSSQTETTQEKRGKNISLRVKGRRGEIEL